MTNLQPSATARDVSSLSANQQKALQALLTTTSIGAAAEQCGLHIGTVKRYLADETFAAVYRDQRVLILQETVAGLQRLGTKAIMVLEGSLDDNDDPNAKLRAARTVLDYIAKLVELERRIRDQDDLEQHLERLEALTAPAHNNGRHPR
jgi:sugar phosphate isomerase/epimerase